MPRLDDKLAVPLAVPAAACAVAPCYGALLSFTAPSLSENGKLSVQAGHSYSINITFAE